MFLKFIKYENTSNKSKKMGKKLVFHTYAKFRDEIKFVVLCAKKKYSFWNMFVVTNEH